MPFTAIFTGTPIPAASQLSGPPSLSDAVTPSNSAFPVLVTVADIDTDCPKSILPWSAFRTVIDASSTK